MISDIRKKKKQDEHDNISSLSFLGKKKADGIHLDENGKLISHNGKSS